MYCQEEASRKDTSTRRMSCTPTYLAHLIMVECKRELEECQCSLDGDGDDCHAWAQQAGIENKHNGYLADMDELFARWIRRERSELFPTTCAARSALCYEEAVHHTHDRKDTEEFNPVTWSPVTQVQLIHNWP